MAGGAWGGPVSQRVPAEGDRLSPDGQDGRPETGYEMRGAARLVSDVSLRCPPSRVVGRAA